MLSDSPSITASAFAAIFFNLLALAALTRLKRWLDHV
jgi:hypothetical protein